MLVTIISDASYCDKTHAAGFGSWVACKRNKKEYGSMLKGAVSSGVAEAMGICNALAFAMKDRLIISGDEVLIQCDAKDAIYILEGNKEYKCSKRNEILSWFTQIVNKYNLKVTFRHVKGHSSVNDKRSKSQRKCDELAYKYMCKARALIQLNKARTKLAESKASPELKGAKQQATKRLKEVSTLIKNRQIKV